MSGDRLVYSTGDGDLRRRDEPRGRSHGPERPPVPNDGVVRIFRERGGRGGKGLTVVRGVPGDLSAVAKDLRKHCGTGGTVKGDAIEIQGDHRERVAKRLEAQGHRVKLAGG